MLSRWLTRRVEFRIGGQDYPLVITHRVLLMAEEISGVDMLSADLQTPPARLLRALLYSALTASGCACTQVDVGAAISHNLRHAQTAIAEAWIASMPEPESRRNGGGAHPSLGWTDAWSAAREDHRLTSDEWLDMTPRMFRALEKARLNQLQREEWLFGNLNATMANFSMHPPKQPLTAESFMIHKLPGNDGPITGEYIMAQMAKLKGR